jgi:hypothetical protein
VVSVSSGICLGSCVDPWGGRRLFDERHALCAATTGTHYPISGRFAPFGIEERVGPVLPTFRIELATATATCGDLASTVAVVHAAGGTEVSVVQTENNPRVECNVEAEDDRQAAWAARRVRMRLTEATPLLVGGWVLVSIMAA